MDLSNLLGPVKKLIFEILYWSGLRTAIQLEESGIELRAFAARFMRLARAEKLKIDVVDASAGIKLFAEEEFSEQACTLFSHLAVDRWQIYMFQTCFIGSFCNPLPT